MTKNTPSITALLLTLLLFTVPAFGGQWLHLSVEEEGSNEGVRINLPLSFAKLLLPIVEDEMRADLSQVEIHDRELSAREMREIWQTIKAEGDYRLASIRGRRSELVLALEGEYLIVRSSRGSRDRVDMRLPIAIVDALFSGSSDRLNLSAALDVLSSYAQQDVTLVDIVDGDDRARVRLWISPHKDR
ncbi:MAG TPA: hypothetical protein VLU25_14040 [Acidobacteriota bacterium]|nr:hypothetical protein [Acidobacteriota bacterium]